MDNFVNAQEMHQKHPDTFWAPSSEQLANLKPNDSIKVCYHPEDSMGERFWVTISSINDNLITGYVDNHLLLDDGINYGDEITFDKNNVYDIIES